MVQRQTSQNSDQAVKKSYDELARIQTQQNALDIYGRHGATIQSTYHQRNQDVIAVNKSDLEDILSFDGISAIFGTIGMFFLSGSVWLIADKGLGEPPFIMTPLLGFCFASVVFGFVFLAAGIYMHSKKRGRITQIFKETTPVR